MYGNFRKKKMRRTATTVPGTGPELNLTTDTLVVNGLKVEGRD